MSERPKTHQERAERAVERIRNPRGLSAEPGKTTADMIAREMHPTELVAASRGLLRIVRAEARYREGKYAEEFATPEIQEAEIALALYPEAP